MNKKQRNQYQRNWRREKRLLQEYLNDSPEENIVDSAEDIVGEGQYTHLHDSNTPRESEQNYDSDGLSSINSEPLPNEMFDMDAELELNEIPDVFSVDIAKWILRNKITRTASNELLSILRVHGHVDLPKCARTLLKTPRIVISSDKCGGDYVYIGLGNGISKVLFENPTTEIANNEISLLVNVDGLPIFKSTGHQLWPILCCFDQLHPFTVALFYGLKKPSDPEEFMADFIAEYKILKERGLVHNGITFTVSIRAFVCDAPARQFLKSIKGHTGYFSCERCEIEGEYISSRVTFHDLDCTLRNDETFRNFGYSGTHQLNLSFLVTDVDTIKQFPLEYMHLVCLGIVKRLLLFWKEGPRMYRLSTPLISEISKNLHQMRGLFPSEFARQPRGLEELKRWKATEFREFLLYSGCVVLKNVLSEGQYIHFLSLSIACRILLEESDDIRTQYLDYARNLLRYFVGKCRELYGETFTVYNVHSLIHICDDALFYKCPLDKISAFPFENYLQVLKNFVRNAQSPISQLVKRVTELEAYGLSTSTHKTGKTSFSTREKDSWFLLRNGDFIQIQNIQRDQTFNCKVFSKHVVQSIFNSPCNSKVFNIVLIKNAIQHHYTMKNINKDTIMRKAVCLPYKYGKVLVPILNNIVN